MKEQESEAGSFILQNIMYDYLVGVDVASTYCYLLKSVDHRNEDTWSYHLLDVMAQGFDPDYMIADGGSGLRAGQKAVMHETPCHGDVFHIQQQFEQVANSLIRRVQGGPTRLLKQTQQMTNTSLKDIVAQKRLSQQVLAEHREQALVLLAQDVNTLLGWFSQDVL